MDKHDLANNASTQFSLTFVGMLPCEELTGLVRGLAQNLAAHEVYARLERRVRYGVYRADVEHAGRKQTVEHCDPSVALSTACAGLGLTARDSQVAAS